MESNINTIDKEEEKQSKKTLSVIKCPWCPLTFSNKVQKCRHLKKCQYKLTKAEQAELMIKTGEGGEIKDLLKELRGIARDYEIKAQEMRRVIAKLERCLATI